MRRPPLRRAFSLVELLVVLAVVGVLAAIVLPILASARAGVRRAVCVSNLRQLGLAFQLYTQDTNGFYPPVRPFQERSFCSLWADRIFPYVRSEQVFVCPDAADEDAEFLAGCPTQVTQAPHTTRYHGSYDVNTFSGTVSIASGGRNLSFPTTITHQSRYRRPSSTALLLDGSGEFVNLSTQQPPFQGVEGLKGYGVDAWHNDGCNVSFVDGHVKWLSLDSLTKRSLWTASGSE